MSEEIEFEKISKIPMNEVWKHEERDFTPWLAKNIQKLGDALGGMQLEVEEIEANAGRFELDIKAIEIGTNKTVVIENQIYKTDHSHLGQLLTYASHFKASVVIWISQEFKEEHKVAIEWLNEITPEEISFYAIEVSVIQIGDSKKAMEFVLKAYPNESNKAISSSKFGTTETGELYRRYFQSLIDELRDKHKFTNARAGQPQNWYSFSSGVKNCYFSCSFAKKGNARTDLYIDSSNKEKNEEILDSFETQKEELQKLFKEELIFERLSTKRACRIAVYINGDIKSDNEELEKIRNWHIETILLFKKVFADKLKIEFQKVEE